MDCSTRPCPSPTPGAYSNSCPSRRWCHPTISSSVVPFSSCPQSFPASGSFPMSWFFASGGQSIHISASASVLPMNIQDWFPLGLTGWISLQSRGLSSLLQHHSSPLTSWLSLSTPSLQAPALFSPSALCLEARGFVGALLIPQGCFQIILPQTPSALNLMLTN